MSTQNVWDEPCEEPEGNERKTALAEAAKICWAEFDAEIAARDRLLAQDNPEGALTRARQAQTAEGLAKAIEALASR